MRARFFPDNTRLRNQRGLTLLEGVLGILILAVGLLGLLPILSNATSQTLLSDHHIAATYLANERLETILADDAFRGFDYITTDHYQYETLNGGFVRQTNITEVNQDDLSTEQAGTGYKKVDVTVSWGDAPNQNVVVTTLLTER